MNTNNQLTNQSISSIINTMHGLTGIEDAVVTRSRAVEAYDLLYFEPLAYIQAQGITHKAQDIGRVSAYTGL